MADEQFHRRTRISDRLVTVLVIGFLGISFLTPAKLMDNHFFWGMYAAFGVAMLLAALYRPFPPSPVNGGFVEWLQYLFPTSLKWIVVLLMMVPRAKDIDDYFTIHLFQTIALLTCVVLFAILVVRQVRHIARERRDRAHSAVSSHHP
jgi:hypothetical protein